MLCNSIQGPPSPENNKNKVHVGIFPVNCFVIITLCNDSVVGVIIYL